MSHVDPDMNDLLNRMNEQQEKANSFFAPQKPSKNWFVKPNRQTLTTIADTENCEDEDKIFVIEVDVTKITERSIGMDKSIWFLTCVDLEDCSFQVVSFRPFKPEQVGKQTLKIRIPKANQSGNPAYRLV